MEKHGLRLEKSLLAKSGNQKTFYFSKDFSRILAQCQNSYSFRSRRKNTDNFQNIKRNINKIKQN